MKTIITSLICIICGYFNSFAQQHTTNQLPDGIIKGVVIDSKTKKPLDYANIVLLKGSSNYAMALSDDEGEFMFKGLPYGSYTVKASYNGYTNNSVSNIEVTASTIIQVKISLVGDGRVVYFTCCCFRRPVEAVFDSTSIKTMEKFNYQNLQKNYAEEKDLQFPCLMQHKSRSIEGALKEQQIKLFNEMRVFPNPASDVLNIESMYDERKLVRLYSITGILVKNTTIVHHTQLEVNDLEEGVYVVQIIDEKNDEKLFQKIVVRH